MDSLGYVVTHSRYGERYAAGVAVFILKNPQALVVTLLVDVEYAVVDGFNHVAERTGGGNTRCHHP